MKTWDAARVASESGAQLLRAPETNTQRETPGPLRASIDSRTVGPGELFVGIRGRHVDGGASAADALRAGAWGVLVSPEHAPAAAGAVGAAGAQVAAGDAPAGVVLAHVDPLAGMQALARGWRRELGAGATRVVAITGSTGKTSTKDILAALLGKELRVAASPENRNTEIGLPLALLDAAADSEVVVLEMAMRGAGQIAELTAIAEPDVGVIVNVGPAHLELLGSIEAIAAAKAELIAGLAPGTAIVIPAGERRLAGHLREDLRTTTFGEGGDVRMGERRADGWVTVTVAQGERELVLRPSFGQAHNLTNLLAAVAAAGALGLSPEGHVQVSFSSMRGQRVELPGGVVLINDCYNANPMSMRAAIEDLAETAAARRVAVLGDMLELGDQSPGLHREIGALAGELGIEVLVTVGPLAGAIAARHPGEAHAVADAAAAAELLEGLLRDGDTVLVKGSRGVGLELVAERLARTPAGSGQR